MQDKTKKRVDFDLFFTNPTQFFDTYKEYPEKALFGFCVKKKSLRHALILLTLKLGPIDLDTKNIILNIITSIKSDRPETTKIESLLMDTDQWQIMKPDLWSHTFESFVNYLVDNETNIHETSEGLITLAIRFYADFNLPKAKVLYEKLSQSGIKPHSRTFLPLVSASSSYEELSNWHYLLRRDLDSDNLPSQDFYEEFFSKLFEFSDITSEKFLSEFRYYRLAYQYLRPSMVNLFRKFLIERTDIKIGDDGLIYQGIGQMPIHKLETVDIPFTKKLQFANKLEKFNQNRKALEVFEEFIQSRRITWDIVLDGANIALYNNSEYFRYDRIVSILKWLTQRGYRVLTILHSSRKKDASILENFIRQNGKHLSIYYTPTHHNDDHFWLYAALTRDSLIISNDEMKDHLFYLGMSLIAEANSYESYADVQIWRERHQIFFTFDRSDRFMIMMPRKFSSVLQLDERNRLIYAPIYDSTISPHYLQSIEFIEGWICFEYPQF